MKLKMFVCNQCNHIDGELRSCTSMVLEPKAPPEHCPYGCGDSEWRLVCVQEKWEWVPGVRARKSGDGYEVVANDRFTCKNSDVLPDGSPFCWKQDVMGHFPCDKCNDYEPKEGK